MYHALSINRNRLRTTSAAKSAVLEMLKDDHRRVKKAFHDFALMDLEADPEACRQLVDFTCAELAMHAVLEEELLYPAVRSVIAEEEMVDEAEVEHAAARQLIEKIRKMQPTDPKYAAHFLVLGEYVKHHVRDEEAEMFPLLVGAKIEWEAMKEAMDIRRAELIAQFPEPPGLLAAKGSGDGSGSAPTRSVSPRHDDDVPLGGGGGERSSATAKPHQARVLAAHGEMPVRRA